MARRGTNNVTLRLDESLWNRLGELTDDRSALLRQFIRWYVREPDAKMPRRPGVNRTDEGDHGGDSSP